MKKTYRIAVIPGDGIGKEVVPEGCACWSRPPAENRLDLTLDCFDFASCDYYRSTAR